ncbi:hypothetical protein ACLOJK_041084 [Asimina triloba]
MKSHSITGATSSVRCRSNKFGAPSSSLKGYHGCRRDPPPVTFDQTIRPIQKHGDNELILTSSTKVVSNHIYTVRPVTMRLPRSDSNSGHHR